MTTFEDIIKRKREISTASELLRTKERGILPASRMELNQNILGRQRRRQVGIFGGEITEQKERLEKAWIEAEQAEQDLISTGECSLTPFSFNLPVFKDMRRTKRGVWW